MVGLGQGYTKNREYIIQKNYQISKGKEIHLYNNLTNKSINKGSMADKYLSLKFRPYLGGEPYKPHPPLLVGLVWEISCRLGTRSKGLFRF